MTPNPLTTRVLDVQKGAFGPWNIWTADGKFHAWSDWAASVCLRAKETHRLAAIVWYEQSFGRRYVDTVKLDQGA